MTETFLANSIQDWLSHPFQYTKYFDQNLTFVNSKYFTNYSFAKPFDDSDFNSIFDVPVQALRNDFMYVQ